MVSYFPAWTAYWYSVSVNMERILINLHIIKDVTDQKIKLM